MERIPLETRRQILQEKLRGASHQEAADRNGVSKGTVVNVFNSAKEGAYPAFDDLEYGAAALAELAKRLDDEQLDVTSAHVGLDVMAWMGDLEIDPDELVSFRDRLESFAEDEEKDVAAFAEAALRLHTVEEGTGYRFDEEILSLLELIEDQGPGTIERLLDVAEAMTALEIEPVEAGLETVYELEEIGFDATTARKVGTELGGLTEDNEDTAISRLVTIYAEYDSLERAIAELKDRKAELEESIDALESDREAHQAAVSRLESTLDQLESSLGELEAMRGELQEDIEHRRSELKTVSAQYEEVEANLQEIQEERAVVHAYRQFIREEDLSEDVLNDLSMWADQSGEEDLISELYTRRPRQELLRILEEMRAGEEFMPVGEHERRMRTAHDLTRDIETIQKEYDAVLAFLDFLDTGDLSEDTVDELRRIKKGRANHLSERRRDEEVREFLVEQLEELTSDREVVAASRHREMLAKRQEAQQEHMEAIYASLAEFADQVESLNARLDDEWIDSTVRRLDTELHEEAELEAAIRTVLAEEVDRRVEEEVERRLVDEINNRIGGLGGTAILATQGG
jgi:DNA repair exonuclease SbcCD ATPase subunit